MINHQIMIKVILKCLFVLSLFTNCTKEIEIVRLESSAKIEGEIRVVDKYGDWSEENEGFKVRLEGTEPARETFTDNNGEYDFDDVPTGTYNIIITKEGYGESQRQGITIVGVNEPVRKEFAWVYELSDITIDNLSIEYVGENLLSIKGIINHTFTSGAPVIMYYLHNSDVPTSTHFMQYSLEYFHGASGAMMEDLVDLDPNLFESGTTIQAVAYGVQDSHACYYDILTGKLIYPSLGPASNIATTSIP